jgi:mycothiol synthase
VLRPLLSAVVDGLAVENDGAVRLWAYRAGPATDQLAATVGMVPVRDLFQMRRPLPVGEPYELTTRTFVVGQDEAAWLRVNNRAFRGHPDQSGWTMADIVDHEAEPWFDPAGFLLHEREGRLAAFCWTKLHHDEDPVLGEIYVIAVDPDFQGLKLGNQLTLAGLASIADRGVTTGMLYVDGDNTAAVTMYEHLGFSIHRTDRAYTRDVAAAR